MNTPARPPLDRLLPALLLVLTGTTGLIDAVSYLALGHVFTANMTGNVVFLGFAMTGADGLSIPCALTALIAFFFGAVIGGRLAQRTEQRRASWIAISFLAEAGLLAAAAIVGVRLAMPAGEGGPLVYVVVILMSAAMGLRNATVRRLAIPNLTTTVLTLTIAGLGADSRLAGGKDPALAMRLGSVACMLAGALVGAMLLWHSVALPLAIAAAVAGACAAVVMFSSRAGRS